jgi:hypothetical protein
MRQLAGWFPGPLCRPAETLLVVDGLRAVLNDVRVFGDGVLFSVTVICDNASQAPRGDDLCLTVRGQVAEASARFKVSSWPSSQTPLYPFCYTVSVTPQSSEYRWWLALSEPVPLRIAVQCERRSGYRAESLISDRDLSEAQVLETDLRRP